MKTTINLPEPLLKSAKIEAAKRGTTLKDLVVRGLQMAIQSPSASQEELRQDRAVRILQALDGKGDQPVTPMTREEIYE